MQEGDKMKLLAAVGIALILACCPLAGAAAGDKQSKQKAEEPEKTALAAAREKGLSWLTTNQAKDGSWGKVWQIPITSFACLAYLAAADEPFTGDRGKALERGLQYLLRKQKDGKFADTRDERSRWIHGQGFATLALSEAYGRSLFCKTQPDLDMTKVRETIAQAVKVIGNTQSKSGGWWYEPGFPNEHEGSTTVCAVQAIVSASNYGIEIDRTVLDKGFDYLKKCQTNEGGFNYTLGDGKNMNDGSKAGMATLALMSKFDNQVMIKAYKYLLKLKTSSGEFPYYGFFYGCMGMRLLGQEFSDDKEYRTRTADYLSALQKHVISWQKKDGTWSLEGWAANNAIARVANPDYPTAIATLTLFITDGRPSICNRAPPRLPKKDH
jgi:hypothetical protein